MDGAGDDDAPAGGVDCPTRPRVAPWLGGLGGFEQGGRLVNELLVVGGSHLPEHRLRCRLVQFGALLVLLEHLRQLRLLAAELAEDERLQPDVAVFDGLIDDRLERRTGEGER